MVNIPDRLGIDYLISTLISLFILIDLNKLNCSELNLNLSQFISNNSNEDTTLKKQIKSSIISAGTTLQRRICYFANWVIKNKNFNF